MTKSALRRQNTCWQAIVLPYIWLFESAIFSEFSISGCHLGRMSILAELGGQQKNQAALLYVAALPFDLRDYCSWLHTQSILHLMLYSLLFKTEMNLRSWLLAQNSKPNKHYCCLDDCLMCTKIWIWDNYWKVGECAYPFFLGLIFRKKTNLAASLPKPEGQSGQVCVRLPGQVSPVVVFCCSHGRGTSCNFWHWRTTWRSTLNKNQLRNQLRKYIQVKRKHFVMQLESWHLFWKTPDHLRLIETRDNDVFCVICRRCRGWKPVLIGSLIRLSTLMPWRRK